MTTTPRLWKSQTKVNTTDGGTYQGFPQIAALDDGGYVVVWQDGSGMHNPSGDAIVGQRYDAAGNKVGGEVKLSQFNTGTQFTPAVTVLANGNIAVAFVDLFGGDDDIYVRIFDPSLNLVRSDNIDTQNGVQTVLPSLTAFDDGSYVVSYVVDDDIVARHVSAAGVVGAQFDIENQIDDQYFPELATLSNGNFVAVYRDESNGAAGNTDIRYGIFTAAGAPALGFASVLVPGASGSGLETEPDVAALRDGGFVVVWTDPDSTVRDIRASILSNTGATVASNLLVNTSTAGVQRHASVVALADGGFLVSWDDENAGLVRAQRFDAGGDKIGSEFTVKAGVAVGTAQAAVLADGRIAFAIGSDLSGDDDIVTTIWTTGWSAVGTGDFNGDGVEDLLWQDAIGTTSEWLMSALGGVASFEATAAGSWNVVATGDFNGDGTDDILWKNAATGATSEWLMAAGSLASNPFTPGAAGWDVVATGDFDNDGTTDVLWQHAATGATSEWLMSAAGGVGSNPATPSAAGWRLAASGDFNGDGTDDLLWHNINTGATSEWLMSNGAVASNPATPSAAGWKLVASGDFDGDGTTDLMWQSRMTGATSEWLMSPAGGVGSNPATPGAAGWNLVAHGDFNGDGTDDLMWQSAATGATSEWLMVGGAVASNPITPPAPGWDVVATGDFNGDAIVDLMWQSALTGATSEWLMAAGGGVGSFPYTPPA